MPALTQLLILASLILPFLNAQLSSWTSCGTGLECASLSVPLEYSNKLTSTATASIALIRYNATVNASQRLGSLLVNPGGPGASGVLFVLAGGAALSTLTGGIYDIIGFDPRGVGSSTPAMECFATAGEEYTFSSSFPSAPNLWLGSFTNSSYDSQIQTAITSFDTSAASLATACETQASEALYTSTTAYVARDMAGIVDALDGTDAKLNYWAFSYGTIYLVEFIQLYPERVGRLIADGVFDGVFDAEANARTYVSQLPNDQVSVQDAMNDFISFCSTAGSANCPFASSSSSVSMKERLDAIFEDLFLNPVDVSEFSVSLDIFSPFFWSFQRIPGTWSKLSHILSGLETRNATFLVNLLTSQAAAPPTDENAAGVGTFNEVVLQCIDNAPSSSITVDEIVNLTKSISVTQDTPLLAADLTPLSFCRNFPDTRPLVANLGICKITETDAILAAAKTSILIINPDHDSTTPLSSAKHLRELLPSSSVLNVRGGPGHTTISLVSLSLAQTVKAFFVSGTVPEDGAFHSSSQDLFPAGAGESIVEATASYNGTTTYTTDEKALMDATYDVFLAFLAI